MPSSDASAGRRGPAAAVAPHPQPGAYRVAATLLWPRLDPDGLRRAGDDPVRLARLAERRTGIPLDRIVGMLERAAALLPPDAVRRRPRIGIAVGPGRPTQSPIPSPVAAGQRAR